MTISLNVKSNDRIYMPISITPREQQVLEYISFGYSGNEMSNALGISKHTVVSHSKNLKEKLQARNSAELVRIGFERGLLK